MALFGKKKSEAPAPPAATTAPASTVDNAFDFDAISRDLDAQNGASSFDALLSQPAKPGAAPVNAAPTSVNAAPTPAPAAMESVFDLPADDPFQMTPPPAPVRAQVQTIPVVPEPEPGAPHTTITTGGADLHMAAPLAPAPIEHEPLSPVVVDTTPATPVQAPTGRVRPLVKPKKSLPLVPLLGGLGLLAVLGGGAMFLSNSQQPLDTPAPPSRPRIATAPVAAPPQTPAVGTVPPVATAPRAPVADAPRSGFPGVAPPVVVAQPTLAPPPATSHPVSTAQNPAVRPANGGIFGASAKGPSATAGLDVGLASRLKALWQAGADAKHRHNYKEARASWEEALRLRPGHPGFGEALAQLPR